MTAPLAGEFVLVACTIARSAFSGERVFRLTMADTGEYAGVAPLDYCLDDDRRPIGRDRPGAGEEVPGFVEACLLAHRGDRVLVGLPNTQVSEAVEIDLARVPFRRIDHAAWEPMT